MMFVAVCGLAPAHANAWEPIPAEAWREPARPDSGGGDAIVLLQRGELAVHDERVSYTVFVRARVFTREGRRIGTVPVDYLAPGWRVTDLQARSVRQDGGITDFDPGRVLYTTQFKFGHDEYRRATIEIPGVEPGCIVEWSYRLESEGSGYAAWPLPLAADVYTCCSVQTRVLPKDVPADYELTWKYFDTPPSHVKETWRPDREHATRVEFEARDMAAPPDEELSVPKPETTPRALTFFRPKRSEYFGYWSAWREVMSIAEQLVEADSVGVMRLAGRFRAEHPDGLQALHAAYEYLQSHVHSRNEAPWERRPELMRQWPKYRYAESVDELLRRDYATDFEINALMAAVAKRLGYPAAMGCVGDRRQQLFDFNVPGPSPQGLLTFVRTSDGPLYLSPSSRFATFGELPWYYRGGSCLFSSRAPEFSRRIAVESGAQGRTAWSIDARLGTDGAIRGDVTGTLAGADGFAFKADLWEQDPSQWRRRVAESLAGDGGPDMAIDSTIVDVPPDSSVFVHGDARWPAVASVAADRIELPVARLAPWRLHPLMAPETRVTPVLFHHARVEDVDIQVHLPAGTQVDRLPGPEQFRNDLGSWSVEYAADDSTLRVRRHVEVQRAQTTVAEYPVVREFFRRLHDADDVVLLVSRRP